MCTQTKHWQLDQKRFVYQKQSYRNQIFDKIDEVWFESYVEKQCDDWYGMAISLKLFENDTEMTLYWAL